MSEHPILFSGPMVRALLDGSKTQTRRVVKPQPPEWVKAWNGNDGLEHFFIDRESDDDSGRHWPDYDNGLRCPYGQPGDRFWVRETFVQGWPLASNGIVDQFDDDGNEKPMTTFYRATSPDLDWCDGGDDCPIKTPWKPSIHMPRKLSRITLEITGVRAERLQDISEADAIAEGCALECMTPTGDDSGSAIHGPGGYRALWESINGPGSWDANPWVWVVEFKRVLP